MQQFQKDGVWDGADEQINFLEQEIMILLKSCQHNLVKIATYRLNKKTITVKLYALFNVYINAT